MAGESFTHQHHLGSPQSIRAASNKRSCGTLPPTIAFYWEVDQGLQFLKSVHFDGGGQQPIEKPFPH